MTDDLALVQPRGLDDPWTRFKLRAAGAIVILVMSVVGIIGMIVTGSLLIVVVGILVFICLLLL